MKKQNNVDLGQFFGPASLVGVVVGTTYLMLIALRVVELDYGFAALVVVGAPLMLTWGWVKQVGTGLLLSIIVVPLTAATFLIGAGLGAGIGG